MLLPLLLPVVSLLPKSSQFSLLVRRHGLQLLFSFVPQPHQDQHLVQSLPFAPDSFGLALALLSFLLLSAPDDPYPINGSVGRKNIFLLYSVWQNDMALKETLFFSRLSSRCVSGEERGVVFGGVFVSENPSGKLVGS